MSSFKHEISEEALFQSVGTKVEVDRENHVVKNVAFFSTKKNLNGRTYTPDAVKQLGDVYEGLPVMADHAQKGTLASVFSGIGTAKNVQWHEASQTYRGDWEYNPHHTNIESLLWTVENQPHTLGFSHRVLGSGKVVRGKERVESISEGISLDLVSKPSTTSSISESAKIEESQMDLKTLKAEHADLVEALRSEFQESQAVSEEVSELREALTAAKEEADKYKSQVEEIEAAEAFKARVNELRDVAEKAGVELEEAKLEKLASLDKELAEGLIEDLKPAAPAKPERKHVASSGTSSSKEGERKAYNKSIFNARGN